MESAVRTPAPVETRHLSPGLPLAALVSGLAGRTGQLPAPAAERKVLRPLFHRLTLPQTLFDLVARAGQAEAAAWVRAAAAGQTARSRRPGVPVRWYVALSSAFPCSDPARQKDCRAALEHGLPDDAWASEVLLGEVLRAARAGADAAGRATPAGHADCEEPGDIRVWPELAQSVVAAVHVGPRRMLDPACGTGVFLLAAFRRAFQRRTEGGQGPREAARAAVTHEVAGIDSDRQAVALAEFSLRLAAWEAGGLDADSPLQLRCADALGPLPGLEGRFDVVAGRPPSAERPGLPRQRRAWLRTCYRGTASGRFNLLTAFIERGWSLLRVGGVISFVVPAGFPSPGCARTIRELAGEHGVESVTPVETGRRGDGAAEYVVLRIRKTKPGKGA